MKNRCSGDDTGNGRIRLQILDAPMAHQTWRPVNRQGVRHVRQKRTF
jgi:hypothetical protein